MPEAIYHRQRYVPEEVEYLRANYAASGASALARALGRTVAAVTAAAHRNGVRRKPRLSECEPELRRLYGLGLYDGPIAAALGVCVATARIWRRSLGLPANCPPQERGRRAQKTLLSKAKAAGERSWFARLHVLRRMRADGRCRGCTNATEADVAGALERAGPGGATSGEIARATGRHVNSVWRSLRALLGAGVIVRAGKGYAFVPPELRHGSRTHYRDDPDEKSP